MASDKDPGIRFELEFSEQGLTLVAGIDEAGSGAWAGPVYAAAAILPIDNPDLADLFEGVRDSKMLSAKRRDEKFALLHEHAVAIGVGKASPQEIDEYGIGPCTRQAMRRAIKALDVEPQALLIDFIALRPPNLPQKVLTKGEQQSMSIAAASIVAKVMRDRHMMDMGERYPEYGFGKHKGYGTQAHKQAILEYGPCEIHRQSYAPVRGRLFSPEEEGSAGETGPGS